jgi:hypothetical protein
MPRIELNRLAQHADGKVGPRGLQGKDTELMGCLEVRRIRIEHLSVAVFRCRETTRGMTRLGVSQRHIALHLRERRTGLRHQPPATRRTWCNRHGDGTEEWMAFFNDPDGRPLAIMSQVKS